MGVSGSKGHWVGAAGSGTSVLQGRRVRRLGDTCYRGIGVGGRRCYRGVGVRGVGFRGVGSGTFVLQGLRAAVDIRGTGGRGLRLPQAAPRAAQSRRARGAVRQLLATRPHRPDPELAASRRSAVTHRDSALPAPAPRHPTPTSRSRRVGPDAGSPCGLAGSLKARPLSRPRLRIGRGAANRSGSCCGAQAEGAGSGASRGPSPRESWALRPGG